MGDSLANVLYGMKNTHNLKLETMINHAKAVTLGTKIVGSCRYAKGQLQQSKSSFKKCQTSFKRNRLRCNKIENNSQNLNILKTLVKSKINVMGHIGFTPQFKKNLKLRVSVAANKKDY